MAPFRHPSLSLRQLQYAVAVEEAGAFGKAAELCAVSQPSLSAQVAKLEESLGVQLFERHARGVHLTGAGRELIPLMRASLASAQEVEATAARLSDPYGTTLRVGVIPTIAPYLLPPLVEGLRGRERSPRVHWVELHTRVCERDLAAGELDAMIIADPPTVPNMRSMEIGWEPFLVVVPEGHDLRGSATLPALAEHELLLLEDGHCLRDQTMSLCMEPGAAESPYRATSLATLVQMVSAGLGVTVLPAMAVDVEIQRARVRALPLVPDDVGRTVHMAWRSRSPHRVLLEPLADAVREAFSTASARRGGRCPTRPPLHNPTT